MNKMRGRDHVEPIPAPEAGRLDATLDNDSPTYRLLPARATVSQWGDVDRSLPPIEQDGPARGCLFAALFTGGTFLAIFGLISFIADVLRLLGVWR